MLSAAQQSFDSCWEEFPVISQNNSLVITPCDRQCVWPLMYFSCDLLSEMGGSRAALGHGRNLSLPWDSGIEGEGAVRDTECGCWRATA